MSFDEWFVNRFGTWPAKALTENYKEITELQEEIKRLQAKLEKLQLQNQYMSEWKAQAFAAREAWEACNSMSGT